MIKNIFMKPICDSCNKESSTLIPVLELEDDESMSKSYLCPSCFLWAIGLKNHLLDENKLTIGLVKDKIREQGYEVED